MDSEAERDSAGRILGRVWMLFRSCPTPGLIAFLVLFCLSVAADSLGEAGSGINLLISLAVIIAQFMVIQTLLRHEELLHEPRRAGRVASFIGVGIATGLAIVLGTLLLIVPGLYLFARWSIVDPLVIGEGATMGEAMGESWDRTEGRVTPIMIAVALLYLPWVAGFCLLYFQPEFLMVDARFFASIAVAEALITASMVSVTYCAVAIYMKGKRAERLDHIFA